MIILASASPRRKELLQTITSDFTVLTAKTKEIAVDGSPEFTVTLNSAEKAKAVDHTKDDCVIAADTVVYLDGKLYLKPNTAENAVKMLKALCGKTHRVYSGLCVIYNGKMYACPVVSEVTLKPLSDEEIEAYVKTESPLDKAGAYGIQDNVVVQSYTGSYSNIMGLPLEKLRSVLSDLGVIK